MGMPRCKADGERRILLIFQNKKINESLDHR